VLKEDPKLNLQDPKENPSWPKLGDLRKRTTPRRSIHTTWMASVGQSPTDHAPAPDHGPEAQSVNGLTIRESRASMAPVFVVLVRPSRGGLVEMMNGKFTFGDLNVVPWCGWWYGMLSIHCTRYSMRVI
ncbi:hypothetical protein MTR67_043734, partial [Solanum verrucosum]